MISFTEDTHKYEGFYRAEVIDNSDPRKLGRIKINIFGVYKDIESSHLPWAVPAMPLFTGSGSGYGYFAVPEIGSHVWCFFEGSDIYQPVYFAEAPSAVYGLPSERTTNYPYRKVHKTKNGIVIYIDDQSQTVRLTHPTGKYLQMDGSGNINVVGAQITIVGDRVDINP